MNFQSMVDPRGKETKYLFGLAQRSEAWHQRRRRCVTASDASIISGRSRWETPYGLWLQKTGKREAAKPSEPMLRGIRLEEPARSFFEQKYGFATEPVCVEHPQLPWAFASLDGINASGKLIQEIKCPSSPEDHKLALAGQVPAAYIAQTQWQLFCAPEAQEVLYCSYYEDEEGEISDALVRVKRDLDYQAWLLAEAAHFQSCVVNKRELVDDNFVEKASKFIAAKYALNKVKEDEQKAREELYGFLKPNQEDRIEGAGVIVIREKHKGKVDWEAIAREKHITDEYRDRFRSEPTYHDKVVLSKK